MAASMASVLIQAQSEQDTQAGDGGREKGRPDASQMFSDLDVDGDGSVTREEFLAGRPEDVSESQASAFFDKLAGSDATSLTEDQFAAALEQAEPPPPPGGTGRAGGPPDASQMFSDLDVDGDGNVTREEFLAGRPEDVSESQASAFFDKLAGTDATSLTEDQFAAALEQAGPPPSADASQASATADSQPLSESLLQQLLQAISSYQESAYRNANASSLLQTSSLTV
ncbi:hypothetical protein A6A04_00910 [Paramagnetospirillum marisnigri]|uniref:EF-hand domain-containing protein n=2 Tax=Paramagnetospirillum marisnigri TaxID=1285242 RepID=A0A178MU00_9PROT|nr:hypothetical protein A6A04_00910 [Paramagnetospirillum marisnigri]